MRIAIDQSTANSKIYLYENGKFIDKVIKAHTQYYPQKGWVEHDPLEIIDNIEKGITEILKKNNLNANEIEYIAITNQRETAVGWQRSTGKPIYNAIVWQCARTTEYCSMLQMHNNLVNKITGLRIDNYFSAPKYNWLLNNIDIANELVAKDDLCLGTMESWIIYNLTRKQYFVTDITNASRTLLMDIEDNQWSSQMIELFEVPSNTLAKIMNPNSDFGTYLGIPIKSVIADSQAALLAQNLNEYTEAKVTMGTGSSIMVNTGACRCGNSKVLTAVYGKNEDNLYAVEGIIKSFGDTLEFVKNNLKAFEDYDEIFEYTFSQSTNGISFIPGQFGLGSPFWINDVGCQVLNLSRDSTISDVAASAIKSLIYQIVTILLEIEIATGVNIEVLKVDGGLSKQQKFLQALADASNKTVIVSEITEASAWGVVESIHNPRNSNCSLGIIPRAKSELELSNWLNDVQLILKK